MSLLKMREKPVLEELPGIGSGYVLNFSDRSFIYFSRETVDAEINFDDLDANLVSNR